MAKHRRFTSHDAETQTGPGRSEKTRGHPQFGLWVEVEGIDPAADSLEVRVEVSPDDEHYAPIHVGAPEVNDAMLLTQDDLVQSDADGTVYVGYLRAHNNPVEYARVNVVTNDGAHPVTTHLFIGGWSGRGKSFNEREDTPHGQLGR